MVGQQAAIMAVAAVAVLMRQVLLEQAQLAAMAALVRLQLSAAVVLLMLAAVVVELIRVELAVLAVLEAVAMLALLVEITPVLQQQLTQVAVVAHQAGKVVVLMAAQAAPASSSCPTP
jgi:hypothetical protein